MAEHIAVVFGTHRIAVYKALYRLIGGFIPDVIAACDQVCCIIMIHHLRVGDSPKKVDLVCCVIM
jgi:hypothetical protein